MDICLGDQGKLSREGGVSVKTRKLSKRSEGLPGRNATLEKAVGAKANEFEKTSSAWEIISLEGGKVWESKPCRSWGQIPEGFYCRHCKVDWTLLSSRCWPVMKGP